MGSLVGTRILLAPDFGAPTNNITEIVSNSQISRGVINTLGLISGNRISSTEFKTIVNGVVAETIARTSVAQPNGSIYIGAQRQNASATNFTNNECAFASIGDGLTDAENLNYYNSIQQFQTSLSRNV